MRTIKFKKNKSADFIIRVNSVENATWQGRVEDVQSGQSQPFHSFLELLNKIHYKLETIGYPQPDTQLRSWDENTFLNAGPSVMDPEHSEEQERSPAEVSTFLVRILYRQNTTWQGTVQSLDKKKTVPFRSLLELIMLINEVVA